MVNLEKKLIGIDLACLTIFIFCLLQPFHVGASTLQASVKKCSFTQDDDSRLACYSSLWDKQESPFREKVYSCLTDGFRSKDKKLYCFDNIDKDVDISKMGNWEWDITISEKHWADAPSNVSTPDKAQRVEVYQYPEKNVMQPRLVITCEGGQTGMYLETIGKYYPIPVRSGIVIAFFDDEKDKQWNNWIKYENRIIYDHYLYSQHPSFENMIHELENHKILNVFIDDARKGPVGKRLKYELTGIKNAVAPFNGLCNISSRY